MYIIFVGKDGFSTSMFLRFPQGLSHLMNFLIKTSIYRGFPIFSHDFPILTSIFDGDLPKDLHISTADPKRTFCEVKRIGTC
jgi:hypothetical protein